MASKKIRKHLSFLEYLMSVSNEIRQDQIKGLKSPELKFLIDVLLNVVHKKISISNESKSQLQAHKHVINDLIKKKKKL